MSKKRSAYIGFFVASAAWFLASGIAATSGHAGRSASNVGIGAFFAILAVTLKRKNEPSAIR